MLGFLGFITEKFALTLKYHKTLNPRLWHRNKLRPGLKAQLIRHAEKFAKFNDLSLSTARDVIITGSNCNFNYTKFSDIDVHLIYDITDKDSDQLYKLKAKWTSDHKGLTLQGFGFPYPLEFYIENVREKTARPSGQGVYSLKSDRWLIIPKHLDRIEILNDPRVLVKIRHEIAYIKKFLLTKGAKSDILAYKERLWKMRSSGLEKGGEFSVENVTYKDLRNRGLIDKLNTRLNQIQ